MPRTFKDSAGREWLVEINPWTMQQVREKTDFPLGKLLDNKLALLKTLMDDGGVLFFKVLYVLCEDQAKKIGVTNEHFGRSLDGDSLEGAFDAFWDAYADFSPSHLREVLREVAAKGNEIGQTMASQALTQLKSITPEMMMEKLKTSNDSAGSLPESSASTPLG